MQMSDAEIAAVLQATYSQPVTRSVGRAIDADDLAASLAVPPAGIPVATPALVQLDQPRADMTVPNEAEAEDGTTVSRFNAEGDPLSGVRQLALPAPVAKRTEQRILHVSRRHYSKLVWRSSSKGHAGNAPFGSTRPQCSTNHAATGKNR